MNMVKTHHLQSSNPSQLDLVNPFFYVKLITWNYRMGISSIISVLSTLYQSYIFIFITAIFVTSRLRRCLNTVSGPERWVPRSWWDMSVRDETPCVLKKLSEFLKKILSGWWFQTFLIFMPIWGRFQFWLIFVKWVETTNQLLLTGSLPVVAKMFYVHPRNKVDPNCFNYIKSIWYYI